MAAQIIKAGPWGGEGGLPWGDNDGEYSGIRKIIVSYDGVAIGSIKIEYDDNGNSVWTEEHGGNNRNHEIEEIQFDDAEEILKSISGFHDAYIRRLACTSNLQTYGPYGSQHEDNFESDPKGDWKIVGFHGRSDAYLRAIGVYLKNLNDGVCRPPTSVGPPPTSGGPQPILVGPQRISVGPSPISVGPWGGISVGPSPISVGPWGGDAGDSSHGLKGISVGPKLISVGPWGGHGGDTWDDVLYSGIYKIKIGHYQNAIISFHIAYIAYDGSIVWRKHGGSHYDQQYGRSHYDQKVELQLDYPQEIITSISGYYDTYYLRSLTFETNLKRKYGPYGSEKGTYFSLPISDGKIVSFHGRSDKYLRSIGVYLSNLHAAVLPECVKVGPWGESKRGDLWDDGAFSGILGIRVLCHDHEGGRDHGRAIGSIGFEYDDNGRHVLSDVHGNNNGQLERTPLDHGVTSISGYYDDTCITSLTFGTSGNEEFDSVTLPAQTRSPLWTHFSIPIGNVKIVGFHGRSDEYLRCIGVYLSN